MKFGEVFDKFGEVFFGIFLAFKTFLNKRMCAAMVNSVTVAMSSGFKENLDTREYKIRQK